MKQTSPSSSNFFDDLLDDTSCESSNEFSDEALNKYLNESLVDKCVVTASLSDATKFSYVRMKYWYKYSPNDILSDDSSKSSS